MDAQGEILKIDKLTTDLQSEYLKVAVQGSGRKADKVVSSALDKKITVNDIYLDIFQPTGYAVGELWQEKLGQCCPGAFGNCDY